jgi:hypothetical protein
MSERGVSTDSHFSPSQESPSGRILLGGVLGAAAGLAAGGLLFASLVVGIFGVVAGAVGGMILAAMPAETA